VTRPVHLEPEAERDITEAAAWYNAQRPGLGTEFTAEARRAMALVEAGPERSPRVAGEIRRILLHRFPYGLYYVIDPELVAVIACVHGRRHPDAWRSRR
jgi:plasmid stabilization system protein ParE